MFLCEMDLPHLPLVLGPMQQIAQQVTAQFQQQHQQTIQDHHHHHHRGMPSRAQLMEGVSKEPQEA